MKVVARMNTRNRHMARRVLVARDGTNCWLCGEHMDESEMTIDHIIPRSKGGGNQLDNLKLAHGDCNCRRGNTVGLAYERAA